MTTIKTLDGACDYLNSIAGYDASKGEFGNAYTLHSAYGGYQLCQYGDGGPRDISPHGTKSETLAFIHAYADGFVAAAVLIEKTNREAK